MTGEKIMVVDDNQDFLAELHEILDCTGYSPTIISDPHFVFDAARALSPDLILLDLKMSGLNGFQVAKKLKESTETAGIPIICMSGYFPVDKRATLLDISDMDHCMKKPFGVLELLKQIEIVLAAARGVKGEALPALAENFDY